jgi:vitamin B12 transporter
MNNPLLAALRILFRISALTAVFLVNQVPVFSQNVSVSGIVIDPTGAFLPRASVEIRKSDGKVVGTAMTNPGGQFAFDLPPGNYRLNAVLAGLSPANGRELAVEPGMRPITVVLQVPPIEQQIIVTATRTDAPVTQLANSTAVISGEEISREGYSNVADALRRVAGLTVTESGGAGQVASLFMRGGESKYTKVLIDGIPVNEPGGAFNFANLSTTGIERIEVVRGPQSALFGSDAIAGVVQIFTHRGTSEGLSPAPIALIEGGTFSTFRYGGGIQGKNRRMDYAALFSRMDTDNEVPNSSFNEATVTGNLGFHLSRKSELRAVFRSETGRAGVPGQSAFHRPDLDQYYRHRDLAGGITFTHATSARWSQKLSYTAADSHQFSANPIDSGSYVSSYEGHTAPFTSYDYTYQTLNQTRRQKIDYQSDITLPFGHFLTAGTEVERQTGTIGDPSWAPLEARRTNYGAYVQDQWAFRNRLFASGGIRLEHNQSFGFFPAPRLGLAFHLHQSAAGSPWGLTKLTGSFGLGIKEPSLVESFSDSPYFRGNPNLRPEKSAGYDFGLEQHLGGGVFQAVFFATHYRDQIGYIVTDYTTYFGTFINLGKARARGLELSSRQQFGAWELIAEYTFLDSEILESASSDPIYARGQGLLRRPRHSGSLELRWKPVPRLLLGATGILVGERVDSDFSGLGLTRNPGYGTLNFLAEYRLGGTVSLFASVRNARNRQYMEVLGYPALRAHFRIGLRFGF